MNRKATRWIGGRSAGVGMLILGVAFAIAPQAHAWGRRFGYGGLGGGGFYGGGYDGGESPSLGGGELSPGSAMVWSSPTSGHLTAGPCCRATTRLRMLTTNITWSPPEERPVCLTFNLVTGSSSTKTRWTPGTFSFSTRRSAPANSPK